MRIKATDLWCYASSTKCRERASHVHLLILAAITIVLLSGCVIPVAPFYDEPFPKNIGTKLTAGVSQDEVLRLLGAPSATRLKGKFWYYGATRPVAFVAGPNGGGAILDYNWIEVAFDSQLHLQYAEHYESKSGCARSGNCLLWGEWDSVSKRMTDRAIFTEPPDHDRVAKMFAPPVNGCAIYVFYTSGTSFIARSLLLDDVVTVGVGDAKPSWLNIDTYIRADVLQGNVEISVGRGSKMQWNCGPSNVSYFWVKTSFSGPNQIEEVDATTGKMEVSRRRLLLSP